MGGETGCGDMYGNNLPSVMGELTSKLIISDVS